MLDWTPNTTTTVQDEPNDPHHLINGGSQYEIGEVDSELKFQLMRRVLREGFQLGVKELTRRGLTNSVKWLSELLQSLESVSDPITQPNLPLSIPTITTPSFPTELISPEYDDDTIMTNFRTSLTTTDLECDTSTYYHVKAHFDSKEFQKVQGYLNSDRIGQSKVLKFLKFYSSLLAGERNAHSPVRDKQGKLVAKPSIPNPAYTEIWNEFYPRYLQATSQRTTPSSTSPSLPRILTEELDPFCLYLLGISARRLDKLELAQEILLSSLYGFPYNWSAWLELSKTVVTRSSYLTILKRLPNTIMKEFFLIMLEWDFRIQEFSQLHTKLNHLNRLFPHSQVVRIHTALFRYHRDDYQQAEELFHQIYHEDPQLLDYADTYSYILHLMEETTKLGNFAERCIKLDRIRPETCCAVGNFYLCKKDPGRARSYFCKALQLDSTFEPAWIMVGHDFIESKQLSSALDAFNHAAELTPRDYRAWVGLGSTYALMNIPSEAIFYYQKALALRPGDPRLWDSLGGIYEQVNRPLAAIKCYEHCLEDYSGATELHFKVGTLYRTIAPTTTPDNTNPFDHPDLLKAAYHFRTGLDQIDLHTTPTTPLSIMVTRALYFLSEFEFHRNHYDDAKFYCTLALHHSQHDRPHGHRLQQLLAKTS